MNDIFRQIAKENGTTEKAVKEEMKFAIREAMKSAEPEAIAFLESSCTGRKRAADRKGHSNDCIEC